MPPLPLLVFVVGTGSLGAEIAAVRLLAPYFAGQVAPISPASGSAARSTPTVPTPLLAWLSPPAWWTFLIMISGSSARRRRWGAFEVPAECAQPSDPVGRRHAPQVRIGGRHVRVPELVPHGDRRASAATGLPSAGGRGVRAELAEDVVQPTQDLAEGMDLRSGAPGEVSRLVAVLRPLVAAVVAEAIDATLARDRGRPGPAPHGFSSGPIFERGKAHGGPRGT